MINNYPSANDKVVLFDGACKMCNAWCRFIIRHDRQGIFKLCDMQSPKGQAIMNWAGVPTDQLNTMVYVDGINFYLKSDALLNIVLHLPKPWRYLHWLKLSQKGFRDWWYDRIAQNRYRIFGRDTECAMPTADNRDRFIGSS